MKGAFSTPVCARKQTIPSLTKAFLQASATATMHCQTEQLVWCPDLTLSQGKGLVSQAWILGLAEVLILVIVSVELQIAQCWVMNLITRFERSNWNCSRFRLIPMNATLWFRWPLHASRASPRIWTCDTRPLLAWAGWDLGTRLQSGRPTHLPLSHPFC